MYHTDFECELFAKERRNSLERGNWAKNIYEYIIFLKYFRDSFSIRKERTVELFSCFSVLQGQKILQRGSPIFLFTSLDANFLIFPRNILSLILMDCTQSWLCFVLFCFQLFQSFKSLFAQTGINFEDWGINSSHPHSSRTESASLYYSFIGLFYLNLS